MEHHHEISEHQQGSTDFHREEERVKRKQLQKKSKEVEAEWL